MFSRRNKEIKKLKNLWKICIIKKEYVKHIRNFKQALTYGLALKKMHREIKFSQETWLKTYIDMNKELRKNAKNNFEKNVFKWKHGKIEISNL